MRFVIMLSILLHFSLYAFEISTDVKNVYFNEGHFRVIAGIAKKDDASIQAIAQKMLDAGEKSWHTQVETLGFQKPHLSDTKPIDIYIANTLAYNYKTLSYETINSNFAGWAASYPDDNAPFFLLNKELTDEQIEVTIAHEFFHTVQYTYFDETTIPDEKWFKNIWWLEATAVLMEDEVYDDINNYVSFLTPFFSQSYKHIETYNGSHEYAMAIYAKYIKEKYGFEIIKESLRRYEISGDKGFFEILDDLLGELYGSSMHEMLVEFSKWIYAPQNYFQDGSLYPNIQKYALNATSKIEKGGILVLEGLTGYAVISRSLYAQRFAQTNDAMIAHGEDILVSNFSSQNIDWELLSQNIINETYFSQPYTLYSYDTYTNSYFWHIGDMLLPKDIFLQEITTPQISYQKMRIKLATRQKIEL